MSSREELLAELNDYVDLNTGRKRRSDAGEKRGKYKGREYSLPQTKMAIYNRVKARIVNRSDNLVKDGNTQLVLEFDENGYYLPIPPMYETRSVNTEQTYDGRKLHHNVARVCVQKEINLEEYRFNAWQEKATDWRSKDEVVMPNPDLKGMLITRYNLPFNELNDLIIKKRITWRELFCEMYYIDPADDLSQWTYELWKSYYKCIPPQLLSPEFMFDIENEPGTPYCHPEWSYYRDKRLAQNMDDEAVEKERKSAQFVGNMRMGKGGHNE